MPSSARANSTSPRQTGQTTDWTTFIRMNAATHQGKLLYYPPLFGTVRLYVESSIRFWGARFRRDEKKQERVQQTAAQMDRD